MGLPLRILVVGVVLLLTAVIVLAGFSGNYGSFDNMIDRWLYGHEIRQCEADAALYCEQEPGGEWGPRHPHCTEYADIFDKDEDTECPV